MQGKKFEQELLKFHAVVENEANQLQFGTITFNIFLKEGMPLIKTLNVVRQRRRKFPQRKGESVCRLIKISKSFVTSPS